MSQSKEIYWPPATNNSIAVSQFVAEGDNIQLLSNIPNGGFLLKDMIRNIIIDSPIDISGSSFVISGIGVLGSSLHGVTGNPIQPIGPVSESLDGGVATPVPSVNIYTQINSITVTGNDALSVSVGYGPSGITRYVNADYDRLVCEVTSSIQFVNYVGMNASIYFSLNRPEAPTPTGGVVPFGVEATTPTFIPAWPIAEGLTADFLTGMAPPISTIWANFKATTTDSSYFTFLQQGL